MPPLDFDHLTHEQKALLVSTASAGQRRVGRSERYFLKPLLKAGWLKLVRETPSGTTILEITDAARVVLLSIPDDLHATAYPLPGDVQTMKAKLRAEQVTLVLVAVKNGRVRAHKTNEDYASLERAGWLKAISTDDVYVTYMLTEPARALLLNIPDELLVYEELLIDLEDIQAMKTRLREQKDSKANSSGTTTPDP